MAIARDYHLVDTYLRLCGDVKKVTLASGTEAHVQILGFRHDDLPGGGKAGISFGFSDVPEIHEMNNGLDTNAGGWRSSKMRKWLNLTFLNLLPVELRNEVAEVKKWTNNAGQLSYKYDASLVTGTSDKVWLLSMTEIFGRLSCQANVPGSYIDIYDAEGSQYKLYEDRKITTSSCGFCSKAKAGAKSKWWLRSPHASCGVDFHYVDEDGRWGDSWDFAKEALGVSPGFCF